MSPCVSVIDIYKALSRLGVTADTARAKLQELALRGIPDDSAMCVLAQYLQRELGVSAEVTSEHITLVGSGVEIDTPKHLQRFLGNFDRGQYRELVDTGWLALAEERDYSWI